MTDTKPAPVLTREMAQELVDALVDLMNTVGIRNFADEKGEMAALRAIASGAVECRPVEQPPAPPAGWKLVPVEPTPEMVKAGEEAFRHYCLVLREYGQIPVYRAMLYASPQPPADAPAGDARDAARYRWLRDNGAAVDAVSARFRRNKWLDAAVDAAMGAPTPPDDLGSSGTVAHQDGGSQCPAKVAPPLSESANIYGFESMSDFEDSELAGRLSGCRAAALNARIGWRAMHEERHIEWHEWEDDEDRKYLAPEGES